MIPSCGRLTAATCSGYIDMGTVKQALHQEESWSGKILHKRSDGRIAEADILIVPFTGHSEHKLEYIVFIRMQPKKGNTLKS